jgi:DNA-directed RNA polymerase specialized sigma24 family protein
MTEQAIDKASRFEAVRARLVALAYRMLGSRAEAEDVVQDVWLKWHLADTREVRAPAAWLTTITTRAAIDRLRHVQRERASQAAGWLPEPWLDEVAPSAEDLAPRTHGSSSACAPRWRRRIGWVCCVSLATRRKSSATRRCARRNGHLWPGKRR